MFRLSWGFNYIFQLATKLKLNIYFGLDSGGDYGSVENFTGPYIMSLNSAPAILVASILYLVLFYKLLSFIGYGQYSLIDIWSKNIILGC